MKNELPIKIAISKKKLIGLFIGAVVFVILGLWFLIYPPTLPYSLLDNETFIRIVGLVTLLFFGTCTFFIGWKLTDTSPGLVIDHNGITDNASGLSVGFIAWEDIKAIRPTQEAGQQFLILKVKKPERYIKKANNRLKKKGLRMNYNEYGSPIVLTTNGLQCDFQELQQILAIQLKKQR